MKDVSGRRLVIGDWLLVIGDACEENIADAWCAIERCENDSVTVTFNERSHGDTGRRKTHLFAFGNKSCQFRD